MKKIVRQNVFESNSSSTHSLAICTKETFEKWRNGELLFDRWEQVFKEPLSYTEEELKKEYFSSKIKRITNGILYKDTYYENIEQLIEKVEVTQKDLDETAKNMDEGLTTQVNYFGYDSWSGLETFSKSFTTPSGDEMVAFGRYGYDG